MEIKYTAHRIKTWWVIESNENPKFGDHFLSVDQNGYKPTLCSEPNQFSLESKIIGQSKNVIDGIPVFEVPKNWDDISKGAFSRLKADLAVKRTKGYTPFECSRIMMAYESGFNDNQVNIVSANELLIDAANILKSFGNGIGEINQLVENIQTQIVNTTIKDAYSLNLELNNKEIKIISYK